MVFTQQCRFSTNINKVLFHLCVRGCLQSSQHVTPAPHQGQPTHDVTMATNMATNHALLWKPTWPPTMPV